LSPPPAGEGSLREIAALFLRLGLTAFGGPAAHIALFEEEFVTRRGWLDRAHFLDLLAATHLVPGPNSTEMAIHIGQVRAGVGGAVVAGVAFIAPSFLAVLALAWAYVRYGALPAVDALFYGIQPVVVAIILGAAWRMGRTSLQGLGLPLLAAVAGIAAWGTPVDSAWILVAAGVVWLLAQRMPRPALPALLVLPPAATSTPLPELFAAFLKIGALLFGSGYVLVAYLEDEIVRRAWVTQAELLDGIAAGQMTPGPVLTTAAFIGYLIRGPAGALTATAAIFLPSFLIVLAMAPFLPRLRSSPATSAFLAGVNAAVVALIVVAALRLAQPLAVDPLRLALVAAALVAQLRFRLPGPYLVLAGALAGLLLTR
jgi:chromate transporter